MPRKYKSKKTTKKFTKRRKFSRKKGLDKKAVKTVKQLIDRKLDEAVEDKYSLDQNFIPVVANYDNASRSLIYEIGPTINRGDQQGQRLSNKINMKYLKMQIRLAGGRTNVKVVSDPVNQTITYVNNLFEDSPKVRIKVVRVVKALADQLGLQTLRDSLDAKYPPYGFWRQDFDQDLGHNVTKGCKTLAKTMLSLKYRQFTTPINENVALNLPMAVQVVHVPQFTHTEMFIKLTKKWELDDATSENISYRYFLFVQFDSKWNDGTYDPVGPPTFLDIRRMYVYEDA